MRSAKSTRLVSAENSSRSKKKTVFVAESDLSLSLSLSLSGRWMRRGGFKEGRVRVGRMGLARVGRFSLPVGFMVCKYYLPRYVCRVYAWLGCRVTESRVIRGGR